MTEDSYAGDIDEIDAWKILAEDPAAVLVDVRTPAEWNYVGVPDTSGLGKRVAFVPWALFPTMEVNPEFVAQMAQLGISKESPLLFVCRSGVRSRAAAIEMTAHGFAPCYNVRHGFEGDPDANGHRGNTSGWKVAGLPWRQS
jgi:rhodanese-related sulfurtransferase